MIDRIKDFLREHGLVGSGSSACNIIIGRSLVFEVFQAPDVYITVKASRNADLQREFESQRVSYSALPEYVPAPLAFGESKGWSFLASEGVPHARLTGATMRSAGDRLAWGIRDFARRSTGAFTNRQWACEHHQELDSTIDSLKDRNLAIALEAYIRRLEVERINVFPHVRQHGDLVPSNIGITHRGMVIFDWEDFGRVELPGFDIGILLMSCLDYNIVLLKRWFEAGEPRGLDKMITAAADELGFSRPMLWRLLPVYLVHFIYLKEILNYRPSVRELVRHLITDLCSLPQVAPDQADRR